MPGSVKVTVVKVPDRKSYEPCVWRLFGLMKHLNRTPKDISQESGIDQKTILSWLYRKRSPTMKNFRAVANTLGYEVVLVPINSVDRYHGPQEIEFKKSASGSK